MIIDIDSETLLTLAEAAKRFPRKLSICTLFRWCKNGVRGAVLSSVVIGGRRFTSLEAIHRFIVATSQRDSARPATEPANANRAKNVAKCLTAKGI